MLCIMLLQNCSETTMHAGQWLVVSDRRVLKIHSPFCILNLRFLITIKSPTLSADFVARGEGRIKAILYCTYILSMPV